MPHTRKEMKAWAKDVWEKTTGHKEEEATFEGWVARGKNGKINLFAVKPTKDEKFGCWVVDFTPGIVLRIKCDETFPSVKWEDDEPTPCEIIVKLK